MGDTQRANPNTQRSQQIVPSQARKIHTENDSWFGFWVFFPYRECLTFKKGIIFRSVVETIF